MWVKIQFSSVCLIFDIHIIHFQYLIYLVVIIFFSLTLTTDNNHSDSDLFDNWCVVASWSLQSATQPFHMWIAWMWQSTIHNYCSNSTSEILPPPHPHRGPQTPRFWPTRIQTLHMYPHNNQFTYLLLYKPPPHTTDNSNGCLLTSSILSGRGTPIALR